MTKIIAIDGTAASGKGTLSKSLAAYLAYDYLDTGSVYRRTAYEAMKKHIDLNDVQALVAIVGEIDYSDEIKEDLHTDEIGSVASQIAVYQPLREVLNIMQRNFVKDKNGNPKKGIVVDGRDIGTVIFPNADLKFFITASVEERAKRRYLQLKSKGKDITLDVVLRDLQERDERDAKRLVSPTIAAPDAVIVDTELLNANEVLDLIISLSRKIIEDDLKAA
jgi:CMP/dCMP kinase